MLQRAPHEYQAVKLRRAFEGVVLHHDRPLRHSHSSPQWVPCFTVQLMQQGILAS